MFGNSECSSCAVQHCKDVAQYTLSAQQLFNDGKYVNYFTSLPGYLRWELRAGWRLEKQVTGDPDWEGGTASKKY